MAKAGGTVPKASPIINVNVTNINIGALGPEQQQLAQQIAAMIAGGVPQMGLPGPPAQPAQPIQPAQPVPKPAFPPVPPFPQMPPTAAMPPDGVDKQEDGKDNQ